MNYTENVIKLVKKYQPCHLKAYRNKRGVWAIGYGHTNGVRMNDTLESEEEALLFLEDDADTIANAVENLLDTGRFSFNPNQNQVDALISFGLDMGIGALTKLVTGRNAKMMGSSLLGQYEIDGKIDKDAKDRRADEYELFISTYELNIKSVDPTVFDKTSVQPAEVPVAEEAPAEEPVIEPEQEVEPETDAEIDTDPEFDEAFIAEHIGSADPEDINVEDVQAEVGDSEGPVETSEVSEDEPAESAEEVTAEETEPETEMPVENEEVNGTDNTEESSEESV